MAAAAASTAEMFPGRQSQIATLERLVAWAEEGVAPAAAVHVWGGPATGKTAVVRAVLERSSTRWAWVNCLECYAPRLLFERMLGELGLPEQRAATLADFATHVQRAVEADGPAHVLVFDHADRIASLSPPSLLAALLRLGEILQRPIIVVLISQLVWDRMRPRVGCADPLIVHFEAYSDEQIVRILERGCPDEERDDPRLYLSFVELVVKVFRHACRNLNELRHVIGALFPKYLEPTRDPVAPVARDPVKLYARIEPYFRTMLAKLYLRDVSLLEWNELASAPGVDAASASSAASASASTLNLPYYVRFLVIAAFLASYNPARLDARYFSRSSEGSAVVSRSRRAAAAAAAAAGKRSEGPVRVRQQLLGPKAFPVDRMLAIFYSILDRPLESTVDIHIQVATLVSLRLLSQVSALDAIESLKYRCQVPFETVRQLAESVHLDIHKLLYDFR